MELLLKILTLPIQDAFLIQFEPFQDDRGFFERFFCQKEIFEYLNIERNIKQINHSFTQKKGAVRGLHFQHPPKSEIKMITCLKGKVFDVMVDLRKSSPTFLKWHAEILSPEKKNMVLIPEGFAHGFQTLENDCELLYFSTEFYDKTSEGALLYCDSSLNIAWPLPATDISVRDLSHLPIKESDFKGIQI